MKRNHYHYWICFKLISSKTKEAYIDNMEYCLQKPISVKDLRLLSASLKKGDDRIRVIITFFNRVECDCNE